MSAKMAVLANLIYWSLDIEASLTKYLQNSCGAASSITVFRLISLSPDFFAKEWTRKQEIHAYLTKIFKKPVLWDNIASNLKNVAMFCRKLANIKL